MAAKETYLITGASGFIGGWLAETLHLTGAADVRAGIRGWSRAVRLARFPIPATIVDVMDPEQVAQAVRGADRVIHCAYGSARTTVEGTRNMLAAAAREGVRRFVYLSTTEVYGLVHGAVDETRPPQSLGNEYSESKIEAERLCWQFCDEGLPVTVVRPTIVYGPFGRTWTVEMATRLQSGNWGVFKGYGDGLCNLVYVSDVVAGVLAAAVHDGAVGQAFNLSGPEVITWNAYFEHFNAALGLPGLAEVDPGRTRLRTTMMSPVRSAARYAQKHFEKPLRRMGQKVRQAKEIMLSAEKSIRTTPRPEDLALYSRDARYVTDKAREVLDYTPRFGVEDGLELTVRWLETVGLAGGVAR